MRYTHPLDRLMFRFRWLIFALTVISAPITLISYGKMMLLAYEAWPSWVFIPVFIAHLVTLVSVGSLFDSQQERRQLTEDEQ